MGIQTGQPLGIRNSHAVSHNVHTFSSRNPDFNQSQPVGSDNLKKSFERTELLIPVKCDMHGWMNSYVGVVDNPFYAVTGEDGSFDLGKLPPGEYTIEAHHESLKRQKQKITVADGVAQTIEFTFSQ